MQILPSGHRPSDRGATGLVLTPFRGVRYVEARVSGLAEVTSPPYDVIASENEDQLLAADPHNVVRIIRPRHPAGQPGSSGDDAAADLRQWLADGILVPDAEPALYVYEQFSAGLDGQPDRLQRGLIGAVELVPREAGIVQPHEAVAPGPVAGRLALMEATQANLEPIFLLYDGHAGTQRLRPQRRHPDRDARPPGTGRRWRRPGPRTASGTGCGPSPTPPSWRRSPPTWPPGRR